MKKKNTINYFIWAVVLLIIVVGGWILIGDKLLEKEGVPYTVYNGYVIYEIKDEKLVRYKVEAYANNGVKYIHNFRNYPSDLLDLDYEEGLREKILYKDLNNNLKKDKIYFSFDPDEDSTAMFSIATLYQVLGTATSGVFKIPVIVSFYEDQDNPDFPLVTCGDATKEIGVIEIRYGEPKVYSEGECIVLQGSNREDFIKYNDLLSYIILGVIQE